MARAILKRPCEDSMVWFTFVAHRRRWVVWLCPRDTVTKLMGPAVEGHTVGGCLWRKAWVLIDASLPIRDIKRVGIHELVHACHGDPKAHADTHERSVRRLEKPLLRVLTTECALRFPPLPHAWRSLQRRLAKHAEKVEL